MNTSLILLVVLSLILSVKALYDADEIVNLPGAEHLEISFKQYSGYLQIPGVSGALTKNMHYWFTQSTTDTFNSPLTFWTNGGPGCSGLIGFMTEQGPFRPQANGSLSLNEYSWNKLSNMVFIESPAGVGFSYSDDKDDNTIGDEQTAIDNYNLIQAFLVKFPEYKNSSLYISSESYGGHYIPQLAKVIVDENTKGVNPKLNFRGFAVGNPYTDKYSGTPAMVETLWGHQLLPLPAYSNYQQICGSKSKVDQAKCSALEYKLSSNYDGNLNPYALDYPVCVTDSLKKKGRAQRTWLLNHLLDQHLTLDEKKQLGVALKEEYEPCADSYTNVYLNRKDVQEAIHVKKTVWTECSYTLNYLMADEDLSTAPIYNYLIDGNFGLDILVYSGDDDSVCGLVGTQSWIWNLGYEIGTNWSPFMLEGQTIGFLTTWPKSKLALLTVHGAGHEVPTYKPKEAFDMFTKYLSGEFTN